MKLLIKSLAGGNFNLDAELTDTIATIKNKIKDAQGHVPELQKIIFSGKILSDEKTISECNIKEKDFLVVMVSKPKVVKPAAASTSSSSSIAPPTESETKTEAVSSTTTTTTDKPAFSEPSAAATASDSPTNTTSTEAASSTPAAADAPASASAQDSDAPLGTSGSFLSGTQLDSVVQNMMEMGFEREQVQKAMRAAFNNPDRAVEYLMTGIPEHLLQPQQPAAAPAQPATAPQTAPASNTTTTTTSSTASNPRAGNLFEAAAAQAQGGRGAAGSGGLGAGSDLLGEDDGSGEQVIDLGNPAMLAQLQQLVQQNPAALQPLVQAIAQTNPHLAEAMNQDPQGVLNLLAGGAAAAGEEMDVPTMQELTTEDRTAVEQIVAMGIPESKAIESYFMCGKNVEMAVQYYFENPQDFDD